MSDDERLYGQPWAEEMHDDIGAVYEDWLDDRYDLPDPDEVVVVEEWTVHHPRHHLPDAFGVAEWLLEQACENGEVGDDYDEHWSPGAAQAAAEVMLHTVAQTIYYRMAHQQVATHRITHDADGQPMLDGALLYGLHGDAKP